MSPRIDTPLGIESASGIEALSAARDTTDLRVASLLPSATEMVCALGLESALVGVSHECDWPAGVRSKRVLTSTKVAHSARSRTIDQDVRRVLRDALAVYDIDIEALRQVAPDVIVTQDLCDVCAVSFDAVRAAVDEVVPGARIVNLHPTRLSDIWSDILHVGRALGREERALAIVRGYRARVEQIEARARAALLGAKARRKPYVLTIEWLDPVMVGGTWMPELVEIAGGEALVTRPGDHAPTLTPEELSALDPAPEFVIVKPCGFNLERTLSESERLREMFAALDWPAVREDRVWIADGNAYFNRPGPRIVESLEILAACLHADSFGDFAERHAAGYVHFSLDRSS